MSKTIEQKYRKLEEVEKVLLRPGRYIGSIKHHTAEVFVMNEATQQMQLASTTWNPGFLKLFDEIITNAVDHSKRPEGKNLDTIKVDINRESGVISVFDNGGIPVVMHKEHNEYVPSLIFGYLHSGSNFDDDEDNSGAGQNGEGSTLTNIFSNQFTVETCDGERQFKQVWSKNMTVKSQPAILDIPGPGFTRITYLPDYDHLETKLDDGNYNKLIKRVYDIAGCNPNLKVYLDGKRIRIDSFKDYIKLYTDQFEYDENEDWQIGIAKSNDGSFEHVSFVNATQTYIGGSHIDYIADQIIDKLREFFKTKYKIKDLKPAEIKNQIRLFINARIDKPRYDSQTKENLITEPKEYKTSWKISDKLLQRLTKSPIIERVLLWVEAKAKAAELAQLKQMNKDANKVNPRYILKLDDAALAGKKPEQCFLFIAEGDSAAKAIISGRNPKTMGALALKGKPLNVNSVDVKKLVDNEEFFNIIAAMGLKIGEPIKSISELRYSKLVITSDADHDGAHIAGLMVSNLYKFWPELFSLGVVHRFFTPVIKVWIKGKKEPLAFETEHEYHDWRSKGSNADSIKSFKYFKGLGTSTAEDFKGYLSNIEHHLAKLTLDTIDGDIINLVFGKEDGSADKRKQWLDISEASV
jgi:DNA topoisomerase-2